MSRDCTIQETDAQLTTTQQKEVTIVLNKTIIPGIAHDAGIPVTQFSQDVEEMSDQIIEGVDIQDLLNEFRIPTDKIIWYLVGVFAKMLISWQISSQISNRYGDTINSAIMRVLDAIISNSTIKNIAAYFIRGYIYSSILAIIWKVIMLASKFHEISFIRKAYDLLKYYKNKLVQRGGGLTTDMEELNSLNNKIINDIENIVKKHNLS
jgi:hypothetical protein